jgi:hypothetical protein
MQRGSQVGNNTRRSFITATAFAALAPLALNARANVGDGNESNASAGLSPSTPSSPKIVVLGNLRREPVIISDLASGVLSDPIQLEGNETYRISVVALGIQRGTPMFNVTLADVEGDALASQQVGPYSAAMFSRCCLSVFGRYGVMVLLAFA